MLSVPPRNVHPRSNRPVGQGILFLNHLAQCRFFGGEVHRTHVGPPLVVSSFAGDDVNSHQYS
ncbi:hypothetical protein JAAARDRAFT_42532 [Jaapia argillacea MUCL 33604]|uniref:Uncharacterized protein n=1 Tax=Jaapia argillacea MUCL 33604 TaxID=933084 RepID=A0A067P5C2_9AGAM|nr:hypothetical protein JAAARDRAFT_42532 [Jaapia argillacea MUCL 33604]